MFRLILSPLLLLLCLNAPVAKAQLRAGLDPSFGNGGLIVEGANDPNEAGAAADIAVQVDSKILVTGDVYTVRYLPNGNKDSSFGLNGLFYNGYLTPGCSANRILIQPDQKIVLCGSVYNRRDSFFALRLHSNGSLDSSFATNGIITAFFGEPNAAALQPNGKILIAGDLSMADASILLRLNSNGSLDSSFGVNGLVKTYIGYGGKITGIGVMADGRIVLSGIYDDSVLDWQAAAIRYLPNGGLDTSFNHTGVAALFRVDYCFAMQLQPDGKIILAGGGLGQGGYLARVNLNGSLDNSFGQGGLFDGLPDMNVRSLTLMADGRVICAGDMDTPEDLALARVKADGSSLDSTFGRNGIIMTQVNATSQDRYYGVALQNDNKILSCGYTRNPPDYRKFIVTRYTADAIPVAISKIGSSKDLINIYPNPAASLLHIAIPKDLLNAYAQLYSLDGRLLKDNEITTQSATINLSDLSPGIYIVKILSGNFTHTQLITKHN